MHSLFVLSLLLATAHGNLNRSHLRAKRIGHVSSHLAPAETHAERFARRGDGGLLDGLGGILSGNNGGTNSPTGGTTSGSSSDNKPSSPPAQTQQPGGPAPPATTSRINPVTTKSSTSSTPITTSGGGGGLLGGLPILSSLGGGLGGVLGGGSSSPSSSPTSPPDSSGPNPTPQPPPSSSNSGILNLPPLLPGPSNTPAPSPSPSPTGPQAPPPPSSSNSGIIGLPPLLPGPTDTPSPTPSGSGSPSPSSSNSGIIGLPPILPGPSDTPSPTPSGSGSPSPSPTNSGPLSLPPLLPGPSDTPSPSPSGSGSPSPSPTSSGGLSLPPILPGPTTTQNPTGSSSSSGDGGVLPTISLPPVFPTDTTSSSTETGSPTITIIPTAPPTSGGIPSNTSDSGSNATTTGGNSTILSLPTTLFPSMSTTVVPTSLSTVLPSTSVEVSSQFSFITASGLSTFSMPATMASDTMTDPDAVATTVSVDFPDPQSQTATPTRPVLPPSLPTRIFSPDSVDPIKDQAMLKGKTLVSLLFKQALNWNFLNQSNQTVGQIFAYFPDVLVNALGLTDADVKTYALQVQVPQPWSGDINTLGSMFLGYIPADQVDMLASLLRAPNSKFYAQPSTVASQLANLVVPAFSLMSVSNGDVDGSGTAGGGNANSSKGGSSKTRTDAIIGVCSAIGGVAALVALWWVLRSIQRRQAAKHRRLSNLSDPNASNGVYGTQHDDRRTSFFYAEDELRGGYSPEAAAIAAAQQQQQQQQPHQQQLHHQQALDGSVMQQRMRPTMQHTPISAPVLQQNSLNW